MTELLSSMTASRFWGRIIVEARVRARSRFKRFLCFVSIEVVFAYTTLNTTELSHTGLYNPCWIHVQDGWHSVPTDAHGLEILFTFPRCFPRFISISNSAGGGSSHTDTCEHTPSRFLHCDLQLIMLAMWKAVTFRLQILVRTSSS
jgi:hypothetical protein